MKQIFILVMILTLFSCSNNEKHEEENENASGTKNDLPKDSVKVIVESAYEKHELNGYDELSNEDSLTSFPISEYNTDIDGIENIKRPKESKIINSKFPTKKLFGIWVQDPSPETPHATFQLTKESFDVADYDGNGNMPYLIENDSITVYYNDFIKKGRILESKNPDELTIHWADSKRPTVYYTWKY